MSGKRLRRCSEVLPPRSKRERVIGPSKLHTSSVRNTAFSARQNNAASPANEAGHTYFDKIVGANNCGDFDASDKQLLLVIRGLRCQPQQPRKDLFACLCLVAKHLPHLYTRSTVLMEILHLLDRKSAGLRSATLTALAAVTLNHSFAPLNEWPWVMLQAYVDDFLEARSWCDVGNPSHVKTFVLNLETAFPKVPIIKPIVTDQSSDCATIGINEFEEVMEEESGTIGGSWSSTTTTHRIRSRFSSSSTEIAKIIVDAVQPLLDAKNAKARYALRLLIKSCGLDGCREIAVKCLQALIVHPALCEMSTTLFDTLSLHLSQSKHGPTLTALMGLKMRSKQSAVCTVSLRRLFKAVDSLWQIGFAALLHTPFWTPSTHAHVFKALLTNDLPRSLPLAIAREFVISIQSNKHKQQIFDLTQWLIVFSPEHRDFDFSDLIISMMQMFIPDEIRMVSKNLSEYMDFLVSFFAQVMMSSTASISQDNSKEKLESDIPTSATTELWSQRIIKIQNASLIFIRKAPKEKTSFLLQKLFFLLDLKHYRHSAKNAVAEAKQFELICAQSSLEISSLEQLLTMTLKENRMEKNDVLNIIFQLVKRDIEWRNNSCVDNTFTTPITSLQHVASRGIVEAILMLTLVNQNTYKKDSAQLVHPALFWRAIVVLFKLTCAHPSSLGRLAFTNIAIISFLVQALLSKNWCLDEKIPIQLEDEYDNISRALSQLQDNTLTPDSVMTFTSAVPILPPSHVIEELKNESITFRLYSMIIRNDDGSLLLDICNKQGAEHVACWLQTAIRENPTLSKRLPLKVLCNLVIQTSNSTSDISVHRALLKRLRESFGSENSSNHHCITHFFLSRLSAHSYSQRRAALYTLAETLLDIKNPSSNNTKITLTQSLQCLRSPVLKHSSSHPFITKALAVECEAEVLEVYLHFLNSASTITNKDNAILSAISLQKHVLSREHVACKLLSRYSSRKLCQTMVINALSSLPSLITKSMQCSTRSVNRGNSVAVPLTLLDAVVTLISFTGVDNGANGDHNVDCQKLVTYLCADNVSFEKSFPSLAQAKRILHMSSKGVSNKLYELALSVATPLQLLDAIARLRCSSVCVDALAAYSNVKVQHASKQFSRSQIHRILRHLRLSYHPDAQRLVKLIAPQPSSSANDVRHEKVPSSHNNNNGNNNGDEWTSLNTLSIECNVKANIINTISACKNIDSKIPTHVSQRQLFLLASLVTRDQQQNAQVLQLLQAATAYSDDVVGGVLRDLQKFLSLSSVHHRIKIQPAWSQEAFIRGVLHEYATRAVVTSSSSSSSSSLSSSSSISFSSLSSLSSSSSSATTTTTNTLVALIETQKDEIMLGESLIAEAITWSSADLNTIITLFQNTLETYTECSPIVYALMTLIDPSNVSHTHAVLHMCSYPNLNHLHRRVLLTQLLTYGTKSVRALTITYCLHSKTDLQWIISALLNVQYDLIPSLDVVARIIDICIHKSQEQNDENELNLRQRISQNSTRLLHHIVTQPYAGCTQRIRVSAAIDYIVARFDQHLKPAIFLLRFLYSFCPSDMVLRYRDTPTVPLLQVATPLHSYVVKIGERLRTQPNTNIRANEYLLWRSMALAHPYFVLRALPTFMILLEQHTCLKPEELKKKSCDLLFAAVLLTLEALLNIICTINDSPMYIINNVVSLLHIFVRFFRQTPHIECITNKSPSVTLFHCEPDKLIHQSSAQTSASIHSVLLSRLSVFVYSLVTKSTLPNTIKCSIAQDFAALIRAYPHVSHLSSVLSVVTRGDDGEAKVIKNSGSLLFMNCSEMAHLERIATVNNTSSVSTHISTSFTSSHWTPKGSVTMWLNALELVSIQNPTQLCSPCIESSLLLKRVSTNNTIIRAFQLVLRLLQVSPIHQGEYELQRLLHFITTSNSSLQLALLEILPEFLCFVPTHTSAAMQILFSLDTTTASYSLTQLIDRIMLRQCSSN